MLSTGPIDRSAFSPERAKQVEGAHHERVFYDSFASRILSGVEGSKALLRAKSNGCERLKS